MLMNGGIAVFSVLINKNPVDQELLLFPQHEPFTAKIAYKCAFYSKPDYPKLQKVPHLKRRQ
jgi:hypothetical protein